MNATRRQGVVDALEALAGFTPANVNGWPDLSGTVQVLLADTWWDRFDPAESVGELLRDEAEVAAVKAAIEPLLEVLEAYNPATPDETYLTHPRWPEVAAKAGAAHRLLAGAG
ncbi:SCO4402 family protein [Crossiella sp. NPDC003009]